MTAAPLDGDLVIEVRAALEAGATPAAALGVARSGPLEAVGRELRLGRGLAELASDVATGDLRADLLVRGMAVAERTGAGAVQAVDQVLAAAEEAAALRRAIDVRTTQARLTATALAALPIVVWGLLVAVSPGALRFYGQPLGVATGIAAVLLMTASRAVSLRIVARAAEVADRVDPLRGTPGRREPARAAALAAPVVVVLGVAAGPGWGLAVGALAATVGLRREGATVRDLGGGGSPETAELLAIAVAAGMPPVTAVAEVARLGPPAARQPLADAAHRLRGGWSLDEAFDGTGLERLGGVLAATARWGAPVGPALLRLAADLRADRRAAGEAAAERTQIALLFPTALLTLPAFGLAVVPPVVWTALGS